MYVDMHKRITFGPYVINLATFRRVFFRHIINETIHQICSKIESVEKSTKHMVQKKQQKAKLLSWGQGRSNIINISITAGDPI